MVMRNDINEMFDPFNEIGVQLYEVENRLEYLEDQMQSIKDFLSILARVLLYFPVEPTLIPNLA
jgi:archaellum component FlaC